jgi:hypothetical protein
VIGLSVSGRCKLQDAPDDFQQVHPIVSGSKSTGALPAFRAYVKPLDPKFLCRWLVQRSLPLFSRSLAGLHYILISYVLVVRVRQLLSTSSAVSSPVGGKCWSDTCQSYLHYNALRSMPLRSHNTTVDACRRFLLGPPPRSRDWQRPPPRPL